jgi:pyruvyltransferase
MNIHVRNLLTYGHEVFIRRRRNRTLTSGKVHPYFWAPSHGFGFASNFGDELMARVFEFLSGRNMEWSKAGTYDRTLFIGGSVIDMARDRDVVWGAGIRDFATPMHFRKNLKVYSVRGPLSRQFLLMKGIECPEVFGDPGILVPELYPELLSLEKTVLRGIVPHYSEYEQTLQMYRDNDDVRVIDPRRAARDVVHDIAQCQYVGASSLHGIIVAESLGIPVFWWRQSNGEPFYKYYDYYLSTQRPVDPVADLVTGFKNLESQGNEPVDFSTQIRGLKESFAELQNDCVF